nr:MAG TPA: hypothetical protein [Caudoviricetes sp.]DAV97739.1 MAG TPA: hypothetical protein [Caudoviricetes sp.]
MGRAHHASGLRCRTSYLFGACIRKKKCACKYPTRLVLSFHS